MKNRAESTNGTVLFIKEKIKLKKENKLCETNQSTPILQPLFLSPSRNDLAGSACRNDPIPSLAL